MFPIRSGQNSALTPDQDQIIYQSLAASAVHEIGKQAILDCSLLMFHQQAADVYHRENEDIPIDTNKDGTYNLYSPEETKQIHKALIDVVMKFHILDENGLGCKLTPLIDSLYGINPLSPDDAADPFLQRVLSGHQTFSSSLFNCNMQQTLAQIKNFDAIENVSEEDSTAIILNSYSAKADDMVDVAIYEDGIVQCACDFCEGFFQILEKEDTIDRSTLNSLQQVMLQCYKF
uniref:Uncharacterized protein n=1 Tax=Marseillevirus LCMAC201 TaxID=2506605 RepID=A0A481YVR3_9VIRU|nr:MAG: hypothetical protein LCMAC201_00910 [Marseillevirus LCMAC201]